MTLGKRYKGKLIPIAAALVAVLLCAFPAMASEEAAGWRGIYDTILKWVNFAILSFLLYRFLKEPIRKFFTGRKAELSKEIESLEKKKEEKINSIDTARKELESSGDRLAAIKERTIRRGEREKEAMINAAREQSRLMLESAKRKVAHRIEQARTNFRSELIDTAVNAAIEQFPREMTDADNKRLLQLFLDDPEMKGHRND